MKISAETVPYSTLIFFLIYNKTQKGFHGGGSRYNAKDKSQHAHWYKSYNVARRCIKKMGKESTDVQDEFTIIEYRAGAIKTHDIKKV